MAFRVASRPTFKTEIDLAPTGAEPGKVEFEFKYIPPSEFQGYGKGKTTREVVFDVTVGWKGMQDKDGADLPFSAEALKDLLDEFYLTNVIWTAFVEELTGIREKN